MVHCTTKDRTSKYGDVVVEVWETGAICTP